MALCGCQSTPPANHPVCDDLYNALLRGDILNQTLSALISRIEKEAADNPSGDANYYPLRLKTERGVIDPAFHQEHEQSADDYRKHYNKQVKFSSLMNTAAKPNDEMVLWQYYGNRLSLYPCEAPGHAIPCNVLSDKRQQLQKDRVTDPVSGSQFYKTMLPIQNSLEVSTGQVFGSKLHDVVFETLKLHYSHYEEITNSFLEALVVTGHIHYSSYTITLQRNWYDSDIHRSVDRSNTSALFPARVLVVDGIKGNVRLVTNDIAQTKCPMKQEFHVNYEIPDSDENSIWLLGVWYQSVTGEASLPSLSDEH